MSVLWAGPAGFVPVTKVDFYINNIRKSSNLISVDTTKNDELSLENDDIDVGNHLFEVRLTLKNGEVVSGSKYFNVEKFGGKVRWGSNLERYYYAANSNVPIKGKIDTNGANPPTRLSMRIKQGHAKWSGWSPVPLDSNGKFSTTRKFKKSGKVEVKIPATAASKSFTASTTVGVWAPSNGGSGSGNSGGGSGGSTTIRCAWITEPNPRYDPYAYTGYGLNMPFHQVYRCL
jgi:hypothetical protein